VFFLFLWLGVIGPYCISSKYNEFVLGYILVSFLLVIPFFISMFKKNIVKGVRNVEKD